MAQRALVERLQGTLSPAAAEHLIDGTHTRRLADNLLSGFSTGQIAKLREQLGQGSGNELRLWPSGKRTAHAAYSSAALALNTFGRWLEQPASLHICGLDDFTELSVEAKLQIDHGGGLANLDVLLADETRVVGIESKLTETLEEHSPTEWKAVYEGRAMQTILSGAWQDVFEDSRSRVLAPKYLDIEQLIKHALSLNSQFPERERHLIYCYWEPANGADVEIVRKHRGEVAELEKRLEGADPAFHAVAHSTVLATWRDLTAPHWVLGHVESLEQRYGGIEIQVS